MKALSAINRWFRTLGQSEPPPPRVVSYTYPDPFLGWEHVENPGMFISQMRPALLDLHERLSKLEGKE